MSLRPEHGVTLVELVISLAAGIVVLMAVLAMLDFSVKESAGAADRVEANQAGRTAMEQLVQELHSSCVAASVTPVVAGSDSTHLKFVSQFGSAAVLVPNFHVVSFANGALTDTVYAATGGTSPSWTFSATPTSSRTMASSLSSGAVNGVTQPVFQYFSYVNGQLSATPLSTPLSATDAANAVQVTISFAAGPSDKSRQADRTVNLSDSVVLRYIPASGLSAVANLPCQ